MMLWIGLLVILFAVDAYAFDKAYPVSSCTVTVAPASAQTEINNRSTGTICVTSGSSAGPTFSGGKDLTVAGPPAWGGAGTWTLTSGITINQSGSRITGFIGANGAQNHINGAQGWRVDHFTITNSAWTDTFYGVGDSVLNTGAVEGLIDHGTCTFCRVVLYGEDTSEAGGAHGGYYRWAEPLNLGTTHGIYIEDNVLTNPGTTIVNFMDTNTGGRLIARFNTISGHYPEFHSIQGVIRAARLMEMYGNTLDIGSVTGFKRTALFRAGVGLVFNNRWTGNWGGATFDIDNVRTGNNGHPESDFGPWGYCPSSTKTVQADAYYNTSGYLCRDQPGASTDASYWTNHPNTPVPAQATQPWLIWNNPSVNESISDIQWDWNGSGDPTDLHLQIVANRDVFSGVAAPQSAPVSVNCSGSNCTSGIGFGTLAQRPANCTPLTHPFTSTNMGPYYWATDQGSWNTSTSNPQGVQQNGADGVLYKCTATNTWTAFYTPLTYPHPLQGAAAPPDTTPPAVPTGLTVTQSVGQ